MTTGTWVRNDICHILSYVLTLLRYILHTGIIPRAIDRLFERLQEQRRKQPGYKYQLLVSFLELYNEELIDLLNPHTANANTTAANNNNNTGNTGMTTTSGPGRGGPGAASVDKFSRKPSTLTIREDGQGGIYWAGVKEEPVSTPEELLRYIYIQYSSVDSYTIYNLLILARFIIC